MANTTQVAEHPLPTLEELTEAEIAVLLANDPLLSAGGLYKDFWADEHADEYAARLRKD